MKKAIQAKKLESLFLLRNCKYTHFTLDKSGLMFDNDKNGAIKHV